MERSINEVVDSFYRNSPSWPMSRPDDLSDDIGNFMRDESKWTRDEVATAIAKFWETQPSPYVTYYIESSGQPRNGVERHDNLASALQAWRDNCGALQARSGGKSRLTNDDEFDALTWVEHSEGGYACGDLVEGIDVDGLSPAQVFEQLA